MIRVTVILLAGVLALAPVASEARLYKWVDDKGVTHYTETPPPDGKGKALDIKTQSTGFGKAAPKTGEAKGAAAKSPQSPAESATARLAGTWATPAGRSPPFSILFQPFGNTVMAQYSQKQGKGGVIGSERYEITAHDGRGSLVVELSDSDRALGISSERIDYVFKGEELDVTLSSGAMRGTYRVIRQAR